MSGIYNNNDNNIKSMRMRFANKNDVFTMQYERRVDDSPTIASNEMKRCSDPSSKAREERERTEIIKRLASKKSKRPNKG